MISRFDLKVKADLRFNNAPEFLIRCRFGEIPAAARNKIAAGTAKRFVRLECRDTYLVKTREAAEASEMSVPASALRGKFQVSGFIVDESETILAKSVPETYDTRGDFPWCASVEHATVQRLYAGIGKNLDRYLAGDFDDLLAGENIKIAQSVFLDSRLPGNLVHERGGENDAENALLVYRSLKGMTPTLAHDEGLWVWATHGPYLEFTRRRWLKGGGDAKQLTRAVQLHFFVRGARGLARSNAIASLWWWAHIASRYERADTDLRETLAILLSRTDIRKNVLERPTMSRNPKVFSAVMDVLRDPPGGEEFFDRSVYRKWFRQINMHGELRMLDAMSEADLRDLFAKLAAEAVKEA